MKSRPTFLVARRAFLSSKYSSLIERPVASRFPGTKAPCFRAQQPLPTRRCCCSAIRWASFAGAQSEAFLDQHYPRMSLYEMDKCSCLSVATWGCSAIRWASSARAQSETLPDQVPPRVSLYEMDKDRIKQVTKRKDLEELISQLERLPTLTADDIGPLVLPLTSVTARKMYGRAGAIWTERILLACLSHLPPDVTKRTSDMPYPTASVYNRAIIAWGNTKSLEGAEKAQRILDLARSEYLREPERAAAPCRRCHKSLVRAWSVAGAAKGPSTAYELLLQMEDLSEITTLLEKAQGKKPRQIEVPYKIDPPDRTVYNSVLSSCANAPVFWHPHAIKRMHRITDRMKQLYNLTGSKEYLLDEYSYQSMLKAYSRYASFAPDPIDPAVVDQIRDVIRRIQHDGLARAFCEIFSVSWAFGVLIEALLKTIPRAKALEEAHQLVRAMAGRTEVDVWRFPPGTYPEQVTLRKLVLAWESSSLPESRAKIDELVEIVTEAPYERTFHLNLAIAEWVESGWVYAPELIEKMLKQSWRIHQGTKREPTGESYALCIKAWVRSSLPEAPHRADLLFNTMHQRYLETNDRHFQPQEQHLRFVMTAWLSRCPLGEKFDGLAGRMYPAEHAEAYLDWLQGAQWLNKPSGSYAMAIRCWAMQVVDLADPSSPNPILRARKRLDELGELIGYLPAFPCNWVLKACTRRQPTVERRKEAYDIALDTFRIGERNARAYVLLFQVFKAHADKLDKAHITVMEEVFQECCERGMLTQDLIWEIVEVVEADSLQRLFGVSYPYAEFIVQCRSSQLKRNGHSGWWEDPPTALLVRNLPVGWSQHADTQRKVKPTRR